MWISLNEYCLYVWCGLKLNYSTAVINWEYMWNLSVHRPLQMFVKAH